MRRPTHREDGVPLIRRQYEPLGFQNLPVLGQDRALREAKRARRRAWLWALVALVAAYGFLVS